MDHNEDRSTLATRGWVTRCHDVTIVTLVTGHVSGGHTAPPFSALSHLMWRLCHTLHFSLNLKILP